MNYQIVQKKKHFQNVSFEIMGDAGDIFGEAAVTCNLLTAMRTVNIRTADGEITLKQIRRVKAILDNPYRDVCKRPFTNYEVMGILGKGRIFENMTTIPGEAGWYYIDTMCIGSNTFVVYKANRKDEGTKAAVYLGEMRVANFYLPYKIIDDVYNFKLEMYDDRFFKEAVMLVMYWYSNSFYNTRQTIKSISVNYRFNNSDYIMEKVR